MRASEFIVESFRVSLDKLVPTRDSHDWNQMDPDVVDIFARRAGTPEWDDTDGTLRVKPRSDGKYDIIDGHHRYAGLKKAGVKDALVTLKTNNILDEANVSVKDQVISDVRKHGGNPQDYFVRFTDIDKLGYSAKQQFGRSLDIDHPDFYPEYIGAGKGKPALWFYPLKTYLNDKNLYAIEKPYLWLVRLKPNSWLQPVNRNTDSKVEAPQGKERVGLMKNISPFPAAIFFKPGFEIINKYYDYGSQHKRHGQVKGPSQGNPSFFDKVRGHV